MPNWIFDCLAATQRRYVNDRIDVIAKPRANENEAPAFRLKCLDCPGKVCYPHALFFDMTIKLFTFSSTHPDPTKLYQTSKST
jgi:hypothetical protein